MGSRALKAILKDLLEKPLNDVQLERICSLPLNKVINPLYSFFFDKQESVRWHAITAVGAVTSRLAAYDMERARIVMRRLMWTLNDESGGIGWGSAEAMGEIMARCAPLAHEYAFILISYANPKGNFIEHDKLQRGVLWGLGRLAQVHPRLVGDAAPFLSIHFAAPDPYLRGFSVWAAGNLRTPLLKEAISDLLNDTSEIQIFTDFKLETICISDLARKALSQISVSQSV